jgi:3-hydroxyisobutyrate dehydrogenase
VVDVALYVDLIGKLGVSSLNAAGPLASFGVERTSVMATR